MQRAVQEAPRLLQSGVSLKLDTLKPIRKAQLFGVASSTCIYVFDGQLLTVELFKPFMFSCQ